MSYHTKIQVLSQVQDAKASSHIQILQTLSEAQKSPLPFKSKGDIIFLMGHHDSVCIGVYRYSAM